MTKFERKIIEWLATYQTGISSETIAFTMLGMPPDSVNQKWHGHNYPHDPSDFARCYRLIKAVPEIQKKFHRMSLLGDVWANLVLQWDKLTRLYEEDKFEELYKELQRLGA